jgi:hypothetical protein
MARRTRPRKTRFGRLWRGLWPDHNPLRRASDRVEAAVAAGLLAAFLISAPLLAFVAGQHAYRMSLHAELAQRATWRPVPAVLLASAPVPAVCWCAVLVKPLAPARWTAPDGTERTGRVLAPPGARSGSTLRVWVSRSGALTGPPLTSSQVVSRAALAAVTASMAVGIVLLGAGALTRWTLDRRRLAAWDAEWRATGPHWTSPH